MKLKTHNLFSIGVLTAIGSLFINPADSLISAGILSITGNTIIDSFGHKMKVIRLPNNKKIKKPIRTYKTHSSLRALIYGFLPAIALFFLAVYLIHMTSIPYRFYKFIPRYAPYWVLLQGLFVGELHLLMDIITEGGIFVKKDGKFGRFALAHIKYDDIFWNTLFQIVGIAFIILTFYHFGGFHGFNYR